MQSKWHGLVKILEIVHTDKDGSILWSKKQLYNMLHTDGEQFILNALFVGGNQSNDFIPDNYFFGLDGRTSISADDVMADVISVEPSGNGYSRQTVSSLNAFQVIQTGGTYQANSPIVTFQASGDDFNLEVSNLFLATDDAPDGVLIASVPLTQTITVSDGQSISMRMSLSLQDTSLV